MGTLMKRRPALLVVLLALASLVVPVPGVRFCGGQAHLGQVAVHGATVFHCHCEHEQQDKDEPADLCTPVPDDNRDLPLATSLPVQPETQPALPGHSIAVSCLPAAAVQAPARLVRPPPGRLRLALICCLRL